MSMTWEEKLAALQAITDTSLCMRAPGDWYVSAHDRAIGGDGLLLTVSYGNGKTPEEAVNADWMEMTILPDHKYIQVGDRKYRWCKFMWREQP